MMIRKALELALVALIANATWHLFGAYSPHFKFRDGVQYAAQYRGESSNGDVQRKILELAAQFDVPLNAADVSVTLDDKHTTVALSYVRPVDLAPGFTYPWPFSLHIDTFTIAPPQREP